MKYVVIHNNIPRPHICSIHSENCPKIQIKGKQSGFFKKEYDSLRDAWNYIKDNEWEYEFCIRCIRKGYMPD